MVNVHLLPFFCDVPTYFCVTAHNSAESIFEPKKVAVVKSTFSTIFYLKRTGSKKKTEQYP